MSNAHPIFGEVIHAYTRRQAIEDGVLVQLSGPGYVGDSWVPKMVAEAGIRFPVAVTLEVFNDCMDVTPAASKRCEDIQGRYWDVLWMLRGAIRRSQDNGDTLLFQLHVTRHKTRPEKVTLKAVCGPGDDGAPVITIMYPDQD